MNTNLYNRSAAIAAITDPSVRSAALAELHDDTVTWHAVTAAADADRAVRSDLQDEIDNARTVTERDALYTLLATRYDWLVATMRDRLTNAPVPSAAAVEADRLRAIVAAERRADGYVDLMLLTEAEHLADMPY